jgi:predicted SAM-dependent methyltransferase
MKIKDTLQFLGWDVINPFILGLKKSKRYRFNDSYVGINLGCGVDNPPGWLGIDGGVYLLFKSVPQAITKMLWNLFNMSNRYTFESYFGKIYSINVIHHDLLDGIPLRENTVPAIYSSHFFEHLYKQDALRLINECYRVLQPGGIIRICVPSLESEVNRIKEAVLAYENGDIEKIQPFVTSELAGFTNKFSVHKYIYNYSALEKALSIAGFVNMSEQSAGKGNIRDVDKLDIRGGLFVEAMKPADS